MGIVQRFLSGSLDRQIRSHFKHLVHTYFAVAPILVVKRIYGYFGVDTPEEELRVKNIFDLATKEKIGGPNDRLARQIAIKYAIRLADKGPYIALLPIHDMLSRIIAERITPDDDIIGYLHEMALVDIEHSNEGRHVYARELLVA